MPHVVAFIRRLRNPSFVEAFNLEPAIESAAGPAEGIGDLPVGLRLVTQLASAELSQLS